MLNNHGVTDLVIIIIVLIIVILLLIPGLHLHLVPVTQEANAHIIVVIAAAALKGVHSLKKSIVLKILLKLFFFRPNAFMSSYLSLHPSEQFILTFTLRVLRDVLETLLGGTDLWILHVRDLLLLLSSKQTLHDSVCVCVDHWCSCHLFACGNLTRVLCYIGIY